MTESLNYIVSDIDEKYVHLCSKLQSDFRVRPRYVPMDANIVERGGNLGAKNTRSAGIRGTQDIYTHELRGQYGFKDTFPRIDLALRMRQARIQATEMRASMAASNVGDMVAKLDDNGAKTNVIDDSMSNRVILEHNGGEGEEGGVKQVKQDDGNGESESVEEKREKAATRIQKWVKRGQLINLNRKLVAAIKIQSHIRRYIVEKRLAGHADLLGRARWARKEHRDRITRKCFNAWINYCETKRKWRRKMEHRIALWSKSKSIHRRSFDRPVEGHRAKMLRTHEGTHVLAKKYYEWRQMAVCMAKMELYVAYQPWLERKWRDESANDAPTVIRVVK